jgi:hypothetical protein
MYCVKCRAPPSSKECCPLGHTYNFSKSGNQNIICDMCGVSARVGDSSIYSDKTCNFDVCEICYESLPNKDAV